MKATQVITVIIILFITGFFIKSIFLTPTQNTPTAKVVSEELQEAQAQDAIIKDEAQEVYLSWGKFNYAPEVIQVKSRMPVKITADMARLTGCFRSMQIPELGISKSLSEGDNVIEFTPEKPGTYTFGCSMGMGNGKIIVT